VNTGYKTEGAEVAPRQAGGKVPLVMDIKGNSLDDGPGIRSVIFLKGCPLSCLWCHNPESKKPGPELGFDGEKCVCCDTCLGICQREALNRESPLFVDRASCDLCFECTEQCPSGALHRIGSEMSLDEMVRAVVKDRPFFDNSGGGVTISGGEPTLYMGFLSQLVAALKSEKVRVLIETCGLFNLERFEKTVLPHVDTLYIDIKLFDDEAHRRYCGAGNRTILENFARLNELSRGNGFTLLPRTPLIPGITDTPDNLQAIARFLSDNGVTTARLLPNNPLWMAKNKKIGAADPCPEEDPMRSWSGEKHIASCKRIFLDRGIAV
jgi:pyruvate formate lyase activating enzyme